MFGFSLLLFSAFVDKVFGRPVFQGWNYVKGSLTQRILGSLGIKERRCGPLVLDMPGRKARSRSHGLEGSLRTATRVFQCA